MEDELKRAKDTAFYLKNLAMDFEMEGMKSTASDLRQASLTIKILVGLLEIKGKNQ